MDIDHISLAITHATAPAFMLGAVAGFISILNNRLDRIVERCRALRAGASSAADDDAAKTVGAALTRRAVLLGNAIYFSVLSALATSVMLVAAFGAALLGIGHGVIVAIMFVAALALLGAALVNLALELRTHMATIDLD